MLPKQGTRVQSLMGELRSHIPCGGSGESHSVVSDSLRPRGLYSPWVSPGWNTGVGNLSLLQGIFLTQGSNPGLPHCRQILYQMSHKGSPHSSRCSQIIKILKIKKEKCLRALSSKKKDETPPHPTPRKNPKQTNKKP